MLKHLGINITVTCKKADILAKLHANREGHRKMVGEARAGYLEAAQSQIDDRLLQLKRGQVVDLQFKLKVPLDYTRVYDTTIAQLDAHQGDEIKLSSSEFNMLVEDEWDWVQNFVSANSSYSGSTRAWSLSKGFEVG